MLCCSHCIMLLCPSRILFLDAYTFCIECWTCMHLYAIVPFWLHVRMIICFAIWSFALLYDHCSHFHMIVWCMIKLFTCFTSYFTLSIFICYIILVLLSLDLPWGSNVFCASVSGYRYICFKCYTASRFRCEWVLPLFPNSRLSLESVIRCFVAE